MRSEVRTRFAMTSDGKVLLGALVFLLLPLTLAGQSPRLAVADRLLSEGRFSEARGALEEWYEIEGEASARGDRQHALWLRALLTTDPALAELDYRRLVIEYPGGPFSDGALLRLAQGARAWGDLPAARQYLEILVRDYPQSPLRIEARTLLTRLDQSPTMPGIASVPSASTATSPPSESASPPAPQPPIPPISSPPAADRADIEGGSFTLQLGAFSTEASARSVAANARAAALEIRVVKVEGSDLVRVRHGAFATRAEAERAALNLRALGFETVISSDREREIGD